MVFVQFIDRNILYFDYNCTETCFLVFPMLLSSVLSIDLYYGPLTRYVKLRVAHAPGMPGAFFPTTSGQLSRHAYRHVHDSVMPLCMSGSLISGFLWSRWREKRSRHSRNPQSHVSGKSPTAWLQSHGKSLSEPVMALFTDAYMRLSAYLRYKQLSKKIAFTCVC